MKPIKEEVKESLFFLSLVLLELIVILGVTVNTQWITLGLVIWIYLFADYLLYTYVVKHLSNQHPSIWEELGKPDFRNFFAKGSIRRQANIFLFFIKNEYHKLEDEILHGFAHLHAMRVIIGFAILIAIFLALVSLVA